MSRVSLPATVNRWIWVWETEIRAAWTAVCPDTSATFNQLLAASLSAQWTAGGSVSVTGSDSSPVEMPGLLGN